jgi:arylsulfatase A-like enzyme
MATAEHPNILVCLADDLGWGDVSYHGADIRTPNIDRLAANGVELDQHYVCPMCTPTRCCLMTGRHPGRFGRHATVPSNPPVLPDGYETLAASLRDAGYDTGIFGKWHLGSAPEYGPNHFGFDLAYGSLAGGIDPYSHRYKEGEFSVTWHRNGELIEERGHATDLICREATRWIETRTEPWFCYVPFTAVHTPVKAPQHWINQYADRRYDDDPDRDRSFKVYAAYASHMDWAVGQLIETLERLCIRDDTIVLFASDNGSIPGDALHDTDKYPGRHEEMPRLGSNLPLRGQKAQMYEGGIRTPAVVSWPGTLGPRRLRTPIHMVDWMPTLCGLTGARPQQDPQWDGSDIWPILSQRQDQVERKPLYWNFRGDLFGARENDWKLIANDEMSPDHAELFDLARDPLESRDLAAQEPERVHRLLEVIASERRLDGISKRPEMP